MPAFRFSPFKAIQPGVLAKLPDPEMAFGLQFCLPTDRQLIELANLKNLQVLSLQGGNITDEGLRN